MTSLREGMAFISPAGSRLQPQRIPVPVSDWGLAAVATHGGAWIGTQGGAAFVSTDGTAPVVIEGLPDERVHTFVEDKRKGRKGRLYIGTENGLAWCELK